jgi:hypothetical protein
MRFVVAIHPGSPYRIAGAIRSHPRIRVIEFLDSGDALKGMIRDEVPLNRGSCSNRRDAT